MTTFYAVSESQSDDMDQFMILPKLYTSGDEAMAEILERVNESREQGEMPPVERLDAMIVVNEQQQVWAEVYMEETEMTWRVHVMQTA